MIHKGDIPAGMVVRHCCPGGENRACVNPDHLILGSKGDNNRDTVLRGKGGRGGPKPQANAPLRIETASLASDGFIYELARKHRSSSTIAARTGLPREHVVTVLEAICDNRGRREASSLESRFWSKVNKTESCWLWTAMTIAGYGRIRMGGKLVGAHQVSWRLHRGPVPNALVVCHNCPGGDNPNCVNPNHLFLASQTENLRDGARKRMRKQPEANPEEMGES